MRACYLDLDGTFLGPDGPSPAGLAALAACRAGGVEVVLMSGRSRRRLAPEARRLGLASYVGELGGCVVVDGTTRWLTGAMRPSARDGTVFEQIAASGAPALLRRKFAGRLRPHAPWHREREVSYLFRGAVDVEEADQVLAEHGHGDLRLLDNGLAAPGVRVYHLLPRGTSKAAGVAEHRRARGYAAAQCLAIGDSREDLAVAPDVGALWLVANATDADPALADEATIHPNITIAAGRYGAGVLEAVAAGLRAPVA
jgi:hydroxymethylpyrimidine pyrophosphatase-like HAD family hydrolase